MAEDFNSHIVLLNLLSVVLDNSSFWKDQQLSWSFLCEMLENLTDLQLQHFQVVPKAAKVFQRNFPELNIEINQ